MTMDEFEDWLELRAWFYSDDDDERGSASATERAFFHM